MLSPSQYPNPNYTLDEALSEELRYRVNTGSDLKKPNIRIATIIAPTVVFSSAFFGIHILVASGAALFVLIVLLMIRIQREGDARSAVCPSCNNGMEKEVHGNLEYFVCHCCNVYAKGREWT